MLTLDLNLASRPFKNDTLPWVGLGLAVVALTLLTVWNVRTYRQNSKWVVDLKQQYSATRTELEQFDRRERGAQRDIATYDLETLHVRADKANEVILWKAFSWTKLFNLLEEVLPDDVQMISIRPIFRPQGADKGRDDKLKGRVPVSVEGVAKNLEAFFALERALLKHPNFDHVEPEGHTQSRTGALAFELKFLYAPEVKPIPQALPEPEPETASNAEGAATAEPMPVQVETAGGEEPESGEPPAATPGGSTAEASVAMAQGENEPAPVAPPVESATADSADGASEQPKRPKPPGTRRRGNRRNAAGEGDR